MNSAVPRYQGAAASAETARLSHFIDGRFVPAGRSSFENRHPATGEVINLVPEADSAAIDDAVKAAKRALKGPWGKMSEQQRSAILRKVADGIMARFDDFFAAKKNPEITFRSTKVSAAGPDQYSIEGEFKIRGVSRKETLNLVVKRDQPNEGRIQGQMAFDRREYGMTRGIPFIKIADRVEVNVDLHVRRVSGPPIQPPK